MFLVNSRNRGLPSSFFICVGKLIKINDVNIDLCIVLSVGG